MQSIGNHLALLHGAVLIGSPGLAEHCCSQGPPSSAAFVSNSLCFVLSFHHCLWTPEKSLASPALFLLTIPFEMGGQVRWGKLVHSDPDISGVNLTTVKRFLCEEVIVTKLYNCHRGAEHVSESLFHV